MTARNKYYRYDYFEITLSTSSNRCSTSATRETDEEGPILARLYYLKYGWTAESVGKGEKQHGQRFYIAVANYLHKQISPGANPTCQATARSISLILCMQSSLTHSSRQLYFSRPLFRIYGHCDFRLIRLIRVDYFRRICKSATSACKIWRGVVPQERRLIASARARAGGGEVWTI